MKRWNFSFFAAIKDIQLLVSPSTKTASGFIFSNKESISIKIFPIVLVGFSQAAFKNNLVF